MTSVKSVKMKNNSCYRRRGKERSNILILYKNITQEYKNWWKNYIFLRPKLEKLHRRNAAVYCTYTYPLHNCNNCAILFAEYFLRHGHNIK